MNDSDHTTQKEISIKLFIIYHCKMKKMGIDISWIKEIIVDISNKA